MTVFKGNEFRNCADSPVVRFKLMSAGGCRGPAENFTGQTS